MADTTKIDVIAHTQRQKTLKLIGSILRRFEGSETAATAAFQKLVDRYCGKPLAEVMRVAPQEIALRLICFKSEPKLSRGKGRWGTVFK